MHLQVLFFNFIKWIKNYLIGNRVVIWSVSICSRVRQIPTPPLRPATLPDSRAPTVPWCRLLERVRPPIARTQQRPVLSRILFLWEKWIKFNNESLIIVCYYRFFMLKKKLTKAGEDLFDEVGEIVPALPPKQGRLQAPNSRGSTPTLGSIAVPRPPSRKGMEVQ